LIHDGLQVANIRTPHLAVVAAVEHPRSLISGQEFAAPTFMRNPFDGSQWCISFFKAGAVGARAGGDER